MKRILITILLIFILTGATTLFAFAESEAPEKAEGEEGNFFAVVYGELEEHSGEVLSALAFLGSLILAFAYKKGLLPIVKGSIGALGTAVTKLKDESERANAEANAVLEKAAEKLVLAENLLSDIGKRLCEIEKELLENKDEHLRGESIYTVMLSQIDMLYSVFMSSSLPLYQKEEVGEKINAMKRQIAKGAASGGETNE